MYIKTFESFESAKDKLEKFIEYFKSIEYILMDDFNNISFDIKILGNKNKTVYGYSYLTAADASAADMCRNIGAYGHNMVKISMSTRHNKLSEEEIEELGLPANQPHQRLYVNKSY